MQSEQQMGCVVKDVAVVSKHMIKNRKGAAPPLMDLEGGNQLDCGRAAQQYG
jgi:hypothetical protein